MPSDLDQTASSLNDNEIVERILAGDTNLYQFLVRRYNRRLYRITWSIVQNEQEAEDVTQEAYVRAYEHLAQFAGRSRFSTWLTRIAVHEAWRRTKRICKEREISAPSASLSNLIHFSDSPAQELLTKQARSLLEQAINALPESQRMVFVMRFLEEMSTADIAECLGITEDVTKMRLSRARHMMWHMLYKLARATSSTAFEFLGERCNRVTRNVLSQVAVMR
jgi:RNA polymerase sigma-70 factor (ECF subfamily)